MKIELVYPSNTYNEKIIPYLNKISSRISDPRIPNLNFEKIKGVRAYEYSWIINKIKVKSGNILDFGSGDSPLPVYLQEQGYNVTAIDNARWHWMRNIEGIGEFLKLQLKTNVNYIIGDVLKLHIEPNQFDIIYSVSVFEHIKTNKYLTKLYYKLISLLKPGGIFLSTIDYYWYKNHLSHYYKYILQVFLRYSPQHAIRKVRDYRFTNIDFSIFGINNIEKIVKGIKTKCSIGIIGKKSL